MHDNMKELDGKVGMKKIQDKPLFAPFSPFPPLPPLLSLFDPLKMMGQMGIEQDGKNVHLNSFKGPVNFFKSFSKTVTSDSKNGTKGYEKETTSYPDEKGNIVTKEKEKKYDEKGQVEKSSTKIEKPKEQPEILIQEEITPVKEEEESPIIIIEDLTPQKEQEEVPKEKKE